MKPLLRARLGSSRWLVCLLGWWLLLGAPAWAAEVTVSAPPLVLTAATRQARLAAQLSEWVDASAQMTLAQARQQVFFPIPGFPNAGFTAAAHWYRVQVSRTSDAPARWLLVLGEPYLDQIDVWVERGDGTLHHTRLGDHVPLAERPLPSPQQVLVLDLPDAQAVTLWLRVSSTSMLNVTGSVWAPQAFADHETREALFLGFLLGGMLVVALVFGGLGLLLAEPVLLVYTVFLASQSLRHLVVSGYSQLLFDPQEPWQSNLIQGLGSLSPVLTGAVLLIYLLNMRRHFPRLLRVYQGAALVTALALLLVVTPAYRLFAPLLLQLGGGLSLLSLVLTGVLWWRLRRLELLLYFLGFMMTVGVALLQMAILRGWLASDGFDTAAYQVSTLLHIGVMSLALALRLHESQRDKAHLAQQSATAIERHAEQRRFIAVLSHEFRNPLASIDRAANLLQVKLAQLPAADGARLGGIRSSVRRLGALVDSFLVSEAVEQQQLTPVLTAQGVAPLLAQAVEAQGAEMTGRLRLEVTPPDLRFALDARLIGIAVGNLLGNALRYSGEAGTVSLSARLDDTDLLLTVADQGPGLSEDELEQLGAAYYRAGSSVGKQGTGLGYFFSRSIVEAHGGTLQASNRPERGLLVSLRLPTVRSMPLAVKN